MEERSSQRGRLEEEMVHSEREESCFLQTGKCDGGGGGGGGWD